jgi:large subunit ribosomal protein L30
VPAPSGTIRIQLVRSPIGYPERQKKTILALGLRKMNQVVERPDSDAIRGMVASVVHLVKVVE